MKKKMLCRCIGILMAGFLLGTSNGRLAVWKDDDPKPFRVYPCPIRLLPKKERNALSRGIRIDSMEDVSWFFENFMS